MRRCVVAICVDEDNFSLAQAAINKNSMLILRLSGNLGTTQL